LLLVVLVKEFGLLALHTDLWLYITS